MYLAELVESVSEVVNLYGVFIATGLAVLAGAGIFIRRHSSKLTK